MLYQNARFTCPVADSKTSQIRWDLSFLSAEDFNDKYGVPPEEVTDVFLHQHSQ